MGHHLTPERLRELFHYDPGTGLFTRKIARGREKQGAVVGHKQTKGYLQVEIDGTAYVLHRLAWLYVHGRWPTTQLDHRDGDRANNRIANLRESTNVQNSYNRGRPKSNTSGCKGVYLFQGKWTAQINAEGERHYLGRFADIDDAAHSVRTAREKLHGTFANHN